MDETLIFRFLRVSLFLAAFVAAAGAAAVAAQGPRVPSLEVVALSGERLSLHEPGKVTEILFVARWCPPCAKAVAAARRRTGTLGRRGYRLIVVGVSRRQNEGDFREWSEELGLRGALVYDVEGRVERALGARLLPWSVVVDAAGKIVHSGSESLPAGQWMRLVGAR
ncbi:MAG: redoxin family protein [Acidobacteriota bacterium]|nr:redoxin family protein [Acidobacteriota bacterium]MDQ7087156.1 redoxin family protein [Acidobacteriota bacterium]